ncbi:ISAzo13-like element transposase-related protein [Noviherbaspirillum pedocola]|uniref:Uncharacterized protein n=1 Tax=Noviherbaspirillum pedocola TaxID=2801341 RepID=A0A934SZL4_9BURK|nr:hypothetical protein [Noviherbaspirillum pedocola]MBK4738637.1 hypothetical protein [Noviherbaspirillum pedocola]
MISVSISLSATTSIPWGDPIVSVDTKKELIGEFKNAGKTWRRLAQPVLVHDWPQDAIGQAVPYGVYEVGANRGFLFVGDCFDTPSFAVDTIGDWPGCTLHARIRASRTIKNGPPSSIKPWNPFFPPVVQICAFLIQRIKNSLYSNMAQRLH